MSRIAVVLLLICALGSGDAMAEATPPGDETVAFWVVEALTEDPRVRSANVDVGCKNGIVVLTGKVQSLIERDYAGLIAQRVQGVRSVTNNITVAATSRPDAVLRDEISGRIDRLSSIRARSITVVVEDGIATLSGTVSSSSQSLDAATAATEVSGVRGLMNTIQVRHKQTRPDSEIEFDVNATLRRDVYLAPLPISVGVANGVVSLSGTVGNAYQRQRAESLAFAIDNVSDVHNSLVVEWLADRSHLQPPVMPDNDELGSQVTMRLRRDNRVQAEGIRVAATDGLVTLSGHVPSQRDRDIAGHIARDVRGAVRINNQLDVRDSARNDNDIRSDILYLFRTDSTLKNSGLKVQSQDGTVTLTGVVTSFYAKVQAGDLAGRVRGVLRVRNDVEVTAGAQPDDSDIAKRVQILFRASAEVRWAVDRITVDVSSGVVTLTGDVNRLIERREAGRIAFTTQGVSGVVNRLTVKRVRYPWNQQNSDPKSAAPGDPYPVFRGDFIERPGQVRG